MMARDWFETIRANVAEMVELERDIEDIETQTGPHGQRTGSIGGGGAHDSLRGIDRIVDAGMREKLQRMRERINPQIEEATAVLYGRSGRGGLAKARSSLDADILCCYYLQGMHWADIARSVARAETKWPTQWCIQRAMRALRFIDQFGAQALADF